MRSLFGLLFVACITAPAYGATPAPAIPAATSAQARVSISGWHLDCNPGKTALTCRVSNQIVQNPGGALLIGFIFGATSDGKTALTMQVPLGASVSSPIGVSITGGPSQSFSYLTCSQQGCFATGSVNADLITAMRSDKGEIHVTYTMLDDNLAGHDVTATISLSGFSQVYDRLHNP
jgi:invasion protein IalB